MTIWKAPKSEEQQIWLLYPELGEADQSVAASHLASYVDLVCRIYERNQNLTDVDQAAKI